MYDTTVIARRVRIKKKKFFQMVSKTLKKNEIKVYDFQWRPLGLSYGTVGG